jgi:hypothetical protein
MTTPYEPILRHEPIHPGETLCAECRYAAINHYCGNKGCRCVCNQIALESKPRLRDPVPEEPLPGWDEPVITYDNGVAWVEPPGKPEDIESWVPGPITIPSPDEWIAPNVEKSDNKVDLMPLALLILTLNVIGLTLAVDTNTAIKAVLIVSTGCAAILAILSTQRDKE